VTGRFRNAEINLGGRRFWTRKTSGVTHQCKMGICGLVGQARPFAGRVLRLVEEVAGLLDTYSFTSLKLTTANQTGTPSKNLGGTHCAHSEENSLWACCFDETLSVHTHVLSRRQVALLPALVFPSGPTANCVPYLFRI
jgi:hypothetical protein